MKLFVSLFIRQRFNVVTQFITPNCSRDETQPFDFVSDEFGEFFPIVKHTHMIYRSGGKKRVEDDDEESRREIRGQFD